MLNSKIMIPEKKEIVITIDVHPGAAPVIMVPRIVIPTEKRKAMIDTPVPIRQAIRSKSIEYEKVILRKSSRILNGL